MQFMQSIRVADGLFADVHNVKRIDGDVPFGADTGEGDIEMVLADGAGDSE